MTIDELRKFTVDNYLLAHFKTLDDQKSAFQGLLDPYKIKNLKELPAEKIGEFKAVVDAKIAEASGK